MINSDNPDDPYMEIADIAALLDVKVTSVRQYRARGELPDADHRVGQSPLWLRSTITTWQAARRGQDWRKGQTEQS